MWREKREAWIETQSELKLTFNWLLTDSKQTLKLNFETSPLDAAEGEHQKRAQICIRYQGAEEDHAEAGERSQRVDTEPVDA